MAKKIKVIAGVAIGGILLVGAIAGGGLAWAYGAANDALTATIEVHEVDFPVPFPLSESELSELRTERQRALASAGDTMPEGETEPKADPLEGMDLDAIARERATSRGKHLVQARYACVACHGTDFAGGTMVDDPAMGRLIGPNITPSGTVKGYTVADWDRSVRHGVLPDGTASLMPCEDFAAMSDHELSDIIVYLGSLPSVDKEMPKSSLGPVGAFLVATGKMALSAATHPDHAREHQVEPPKTDETVEFGQHLLQICTGCHGSKLSGGPIPSGPPDWPEAANLTPHEQGLAAWTYEEFVTSMRDAKRPDGTSLRAPMSDMQEMARNMTETEMRALWLALQALPPVATGQ